MSLSPRSQSVRRVLAAAALAASGTVATQLAVRWSDLPTSITMATFFTLAAIGVTRRSVLGQVAGRALAVIPAVPLLYELLVKQHASAPILAIGGGAIAALALTRPLLHTDEARAEFAPIRFRRLFLAAATVAFTSGTLFSFASFESAAHGHVASAIGSALLGSSLLGTAVGIVRMRGWGVLLAVLSTVIAFTSAAFFGVPLAAALLAAAPGFLVGGALATARLAPETAPLPARVASYEAAPEPARVRVGELEELDAEIEPPAARAQTR